MGKRKLFSTLLVVTIIIFMFTNIFLYGPFVMFSKADPGNISDVWNNATTLNVTVLQLQPRINWYDFQYNQSGTWVSRLNQQIDVNNSAEYRFCVNISSDQGWEDIEYINITAWHDAGDDTTYNNYTYHNNTLPGGNINLFLQYENITGTANFTLHWPDDEATIGEWTESNETDADGSPGNTECHNLTFSFIPNYQFRYAPGDGLWEDGPGYNDTWSWNFNITAVDQAGNMSYENPIIGETVDEFGVYSYTQIVSVGWPSITGNPGTTATVNDPGGSGNITIETISNGNYSLSVNLSQLDHASNPTANMANTTVSLRGGNLTSVTAFPGNGPLYLWGNSDPSHQWAENNSNNKITNDVEYRIAIPLAQLPGDYTGDLYYHLITET
jgi:hypothetical protein